MQIIQKKNWQFYLDNNNDNDSINTSWTVLCFSNCVILYSLQLSQLKDLLNCRFSNANVPINENICNQGEGLCILEIYIFFLLHFGKYCWNNLWCKNISLLIYLVIIPICNSLSSCYYLPGYRFKRNMLKEIK